MKEEDEEVVMPGKERIKCSDLSSLVCHSLRVCLCSLLHQVQQAITSN